MVMVYTVKNTRPGVYGTGTSGQRPCPFLHDKRERIPGPMYENKILALLEVAKTMIEMASVYLGSWPTEDPNRRRQGGTALESFHS